MIALWMLAATAFGALAALTAASLERALRLAQRQGRGAWVAALLVTATWPALAPALRGTTPQSVAVGVAVSMGPLTSDSTPAPAPATPWRTRFATLDTPLLAIWGLASALLLLRAALAMRVLRRIARDAGTREVEGRPVLISPTVGPAAFGVVRPRIVLPTWIFELDEAMRDLVTRHEIEHVVARDPALLTGAWLLAALMPWNVALWFIVRRLRTATELDCDHRVVRRGVDPRRYAHLLLLIAQRQRSTAFASMIAGSPSTLHERILAMHSTPPRRPMLRIAASLAIAITVGGVAATPALARQLANVRDRIVTEPSPALTIAEPSAPLMEAPTTPTDPAKMRDAKAVAVEPARTRPRPILRVAEPDVASVAEPVAIIEPSALQDTVKKKPMFEFKVDSQVTLAPGSAQPRYPDILKTAGVNGVTVVQIVVDTTGLPIVSTLKVVRSDHELFTQAVKKSLDGTRFTPARVGERHVRQLVQIVYRFRIEGTTLSDTTAAPAGLRTIEVRITGAAR